MTLKLMTIFLALGISSNFIGILINPVSIILAVPLIIYIFDKPFRIGYLLFICYYFGLFELGPLFLSIPIDEIPLLVSTKLISIIIYSMTSFILYSTLTLLIYVFKDRK